MELFSSEFLQCALAQRHARSHGVPMVVVGTHLDQREDKALEEGVEEQEAPVTHQEGEEAARELGAVAYLECSALTREGVTEVFHTAITAALESQGARARAKASSRTCCLLL